MISIYGFNTVTVNHVFVEVIVPNKDAPGSGSTIVEHVDKITESFEYGRKSTLQVSTTIAQKRKALTNMGGIVYQNSPHE